MIYCVARGRRIVLCRVWVYAFDWFYKYQSYWFYGEGVCSLVFPSFKIREHTEFCVESSAGSGVMVAREGKGVYGRGMCREIAFWGEIDGRMYPVLCSEYTGALEEALDSTADSDGKIAKIRQELIASKHETAS